ncbi:MAG: hypothetical protein DRO98_03490 [Archaeoglobales archaeon]|nr:MAG: hypothetical protein DRO98_03490 [Archaeoglobales archaeon]
MLYVFIDESGNLGFTKKSTKYYVIASVETRNLTELNGVVKKVRKTLRKKKKNIPEFKFTRSDDVIRRRFLSRLIEIDVSFSVIVLQKQTVYNYLKDKKEKLHNYLAGFLAESLSYDYSDEREFKIIVDKFIMSKEKRSEFDWYLERRLLNSYEGVDFPRIGILHEGSQQHPGLQAADFVAGSVFQYYERGKTQYYNIIKPKIRLELRKWF